MIILLITLFLIPTIICVTGFVTDDTPIGKQLNEPWETCKDVLGGALLGGVIGIVFCAIAIQIATIADTSYITTNEGGQYGGGVRVKETPTEIKKLMSENKTITLTKPSILFGGKPVTITTKNIVTVE